MPCLQSHISPWKIVTGENFRTKMRNFSWKRLFAMLQCMVKRNFTEKLEVAILRRFDGKIAILILVVMNFTKNEWFHEIFVAGPYENTYWGKAIYLRLSRLHKGLHAIRTVENASEAARWRETFCLLLPWVILLQIISLSNPLPKKNWNYLFKPRYLTL